MNNDYVVGHDGIFVNLDGVGAVFLGIGLLDDLSGQLTGLAQGYKTGIELGGENGTANKAAGLDTNDSGHTLVTVQVSHGTRHDLERLGVLECGGQVLELNTRNREIRNIADHAFYFL